jgi:hypothetical protein
VHPLKSGKLLVSYRNAWGTTGSCVFVFDAKEKFSYQPNSVIWDDARCKLGKDAMEIQSGDGRENAVEFTLYPVEDDDSAVEFEAELMVKEASANGCLISAGGWVRILPNRVEMADRPADGFAIDATKFHKYRIVNREHRIRVYVDSEMKLQTSTDGVFTRLVHFGNRAGISATAPQAKDGTTRKPLREAGYEQNASRSMWRSMAVKVQNRRDHSIDWRWSPADGYPDQFRRDRVIRLERNGTFSAGNSGYSNWAQLRDGTVVVVDYTSGNPPLSHPALRAYRLKV